MPPRPLCAIVALGWLAALAGCRPSQTEPRPGPAASSTSAAISASAPPVTPSATTSPAPALTGSPRPSPREWCDADYALLGTGAQDDEGRPIAVCEMLVVREWVMIACPPSGNSPYGSPGPTYSHATPGGGTMATADELRVGPKSARKDAVVVALRPGTRAEPTFIYRYLRHPDMPMKEPFVLELPANATSLDARLLDGKPWPAMKKRDRPRACDDLGP